VSGFVGREDELKRLATAYDSPQSEFVVVYGRRRVGKTELLLRSIRERPAIYYVGKTSTPMLQMREFLQESARVLDEPLLAEIEPKSWKHALQLVADRFSGEGKLVIVLDEFQWMAGASPELPSELQQLWDRSWKGSGRIAVVLCGSFIGFMERDVLGRNSPLFGRRTLQIRLQPFGYLDAARFFPRWSNLERARAYFVCGGIPWYLRAFDPGRSVDQNITEQLLDEFSPLHREPEFLLREELREVENYYAVLRAVASGSRTSAQIASQTGIPERSLHYYVGQLAGLGYIAKRHPLTAGRPNARVVRYALEDPLLRFWFRFVFPNNSFIGRATPREAFAQRIRPELPAYEGGCFERLCREALPRLYAAEGITDDFEIGEYWNRDVQIDLVGRRGDGWVDLGECKWGTVRSATGLQRELDAKVPHYPAPTGTTVQRRFFVRSKATRLKARAGDRWHDLDDLYDVD